MSSSSPQVVLEIATGEMAGRTVPLVQRETVFGRTDAAQVAIQSDRLMSSRHFIIAIDNHRITLRDLKSRNGTFVNGRQIDVCDLNEGDEIRCGYTSFVVRTAEAPERNDDGLVAGNMPLSATMPSRATDIGREHRFGGNDGVAPSADDPRDSKRLPRLNRQHLDMQHDICPSGLNRLTGIIPEHATPLQLITGLLDSQLTSWLIDFRKIRLPVPPTIVVAESTPFQDLPEVAAAQLPLLLAPREIEQIADWSTHLHNGWGRNAVIAIMSRLDKAALLAVIRGLTSEDIDNGCYAIGWPVTAEAFLFANTGGIGLKLCENVEAVVFESLKDDDAWQMYSRHDLSPLLPKATVPDQ